MSEEINSIAFTYKESYVAFLDVLGFKEMVKKNNGKNNEKLSKYFHEVSKIINDLKDIDRKRNIGYIVISDSIILTVEKNKNHHADTKTLRQICIAVSKIQKQLALNDIWLRGAISSGKTYFDEQNNQIVGPAYIDAYLLEEDMAKYPRVILDNKIFNDLDFETSDDFIKAINRSEQNEERYIALYDWNKNIFVTNRIIEQDILFFIDYLENVVENEEEFEQLYKNIKANIYSETRISSKFRWVCNYLHTVAYRQEYKDKPESIKIREKLSKI